MPPQSGKGSVGVNRVEQPLFKGGSEKAQGQANLQQRIVHYNTVDKFAVLKCSFKISNNRLVDTNRLRAFL